MNTGKAQQVGVFGADHGYSGGVDTAVSARRISGDGAIGIVGQGAQAGKICIPDTGQATNHFVDDVFAVILANEQDVEIWWTSN